MRITLIFLALIFSVSISYSQSTKMTNKANAKVEKLNKLISSENPDLALSQEQKDKIYKLELQKIMDIKKINKSEGTKEDKKAQKKAINKQVTKTILKEILTKKQKKARKAAKAKLRQNKNHNKSNK